MASSYSSLLRFELIGSGEQTNTWGTTLNTQLGTLIDKAIAGTATITVSDAGDTTLSTANGADDEARSAALKLTGTLTAARNVICPTSSKLYVVTNSTTGGYAVTVKTSGGTGIAVASGKTVILYCDGTNVLAVGTDGTVTSVALSLPAIFSVSGSPVTTTGTLTATLASQSQNLLWASPDSSSGAPTFRALVNNDLPTVALTKGGTGQTTANASFNALAPSQATHSGKFLTTNGTDTSWATVSGGTGTVTSIDVSGGTTGLTSSGGPVTTTGTITLAGTLAIANGGTGQTTAAAARNALLPSQSAGALLLSDGANVSFATTLTAKITTVTSGAGAASITLPHGSAPSSPDNGDMWTTTAGLFSRINAATKTVAFTDSNITGTAAGLSSTLGVASGGTGATTLTGILKGNGTSAFTAVTAPTGTIVGTTDAQTLTNKTLSSADCNNTYIYSVKAVGFYAEYDNGNSTASATVTLTNGQKQKITLNSATVALTISATSAQTGTYQLRLIQDAIGSRTVNWTGLTSTKWLGSTSAPSINSAANSETIVNIFVASSSVVCQSMSRVGAV